MIQRSEMFQSGLFKAALIALLTVVAAAPVHAGCSGKINGSTAVSGLTPYDPFRASDTVDDYKLSIRNTGGEACSYAVVFRSANMPPRLGDALGFMLTSANGRPLVVDATSGVPAAGPIGAPVFANGTAEFAYRVEIPRGQFAAPGAYASTLTLELYALDSSGQPEKMPADSTTLHLTYSVPQVLKVNIKGAGTTTTLDFGELATGAQKTVIVEARSNLDYDLDISSDNHGAMALTPSVPGQTWTVSYEARLNRQPLDLHSGTSVRKLPRTADVDASHVLDVVIGDVAKKRAGIYEDVITVHIIAAAL